jgi:hypothetical protein
MGNKNFHLVAGIIFAIVSLLHLWRAISSLPLIVGTWELPVSLSWAAFVLIGFMSIWAFKSMKK